MAIAPVLGAWVYIYVCFFASDILFNNLKNGLLNRVLYGDLLTRAVSLSGHQRKLTTFSCSFLLLIGANTFLIKSGQVSKAS